MQHSTYSDSSSRHLPAFRMADIALTQQGITDMLQLFVILQPHFRREIMARARSFAEGRMGGDDLVVLGISNLRNRREVDMRNSGEGVGR